MASTPREIGTLIIVVLKARNLPNKRHIGKQDPYCTLEFNRDKRRTKAVKRGGQHPEWDEEVRFTLFEDPGESTAPTGDDTPPPPPPKKASERRVKGGSTLWIACYADDPREPDLIGEARVDLAEVLKKGETDEWFTLNYKDKYSGEVYLEMTFWSNDKPPEKKPSPQENAQNPNYGGPGSFSPAIKRAPSDSEQAGPQTRIPFHTPPHHQGSLPSSLRPSNSFSNVDLYVAPYEQQEPNEPSHYDVSHLTNGMTHLGMGGGTSRRRESFPPTRHEQYTSSDPGTFFHSSLGPSQTPYPHFDDFRPASSMSSISSMSSFQGYGSPAQSNSSYSSAPYGFPPVPEMNPGPHYHIPLVGGEAPWMDPTTSHYQDPQASRIATYTPSFTPQPPSFFPPSTPVPYHAAPPPLQISATPTPHVYQSYTPAPPLPPSATPLPHPYPPALPASLPTTPQPPSVQALPNQMPNVTQHPMTPSNASPARPLPDPQGQYTPSHSLPNVPTTSFDHGLQSGGTIRGSFVNPGLPPPLPAPKRRTSLPFTPPPPPPPLPSSSFTPPGPPPPLPATSFDFSGSSRMNNETPSLSAPPPPQLLRHSQSLSASGTYRPTSSFPGPPPPPPPLNYSRVA